MDMDWVHEPRVTLQTQRDILRIPSSLNAANIKPLLVGKKRTAAHAT